ncbi:hypothetical protein V5F44_07460 [Xanthobacter sp. V2C-8]|uniref:hypothetical protein n=1 Tax=Xanthobacter albus TaxID=3119929 RepID=UPI00372BFF17
MSRSIFPTPAPLPDDPPRMVHAIQRLNSLGISFERKTAYQLKIDEWNFYPGRGTIVRDGHPAAEPDRGLTALLAHLLAHGKTAHPQKSRLSHSDTP